MFRISEEILMTQENQKEEQSPQQAADQVFPYFIVVVFLRSLALPPRRQHSLVAEA
jgi:hypothetical protein